MSNLFCGDKVTIQPKTLKWYPELTEAGLTEQSVGTIKVLHQVGLWATTVEFDNNVTFRFEPHELIKVQS